MVRENIAPLSGFVAYSPDMQAKFDQLKDLVAGVHHAYGFRSLDLPLIYRAEALLAKSGGETDKQVYRIKKGEAELAVRFDLTVPLAMYVAGRDRELAFPLKASQINRSYRGEKVQRGRERELYQCDADVIARGKLDIGYDAEVIAVAADIYRRMNIGPFTIRVANRRLLGGFLQELGLEDVKPAMSVIDDAEKISEEDLVKELRGLGLGQGQIQKLQSLIKFSGGLDELAEVLGIGAGGDSASELMRQGFLELVAVMEQLEVRGVVEAKVDLQIVRGLDYYTGTVFETRLEEVPEIGSIGSGGRYDNLVGNYSNEQFEGVGFSVGLTRLFNSLAELGKLPELATEAKVVLVPVAKEQMGFCLEKASEWRKNGESVDVYLQGGKLDKALKYAAGSGATEVVVVGEEEVRSGNLERRTVK
ncbi:histidine--tRNA ligase [Candidatus Saccharibacteria bacterium]|nr:histidine--tRNA ligase [Candidatus Saccharibacteria bacterium]